MHRAIDGIGVDVFVVRGIVFFVEIVGVSVWIEFDEFICVAFIFNHNWVVIERIVLQ